MKKRLQQTLVMALVVIACACSVATAWAETYYVRPDGDNSGTGLANSPESAWKTLQYAADSSAPGDVILVQAGVYPEKVTINNTGTAALPIVFRGEGDVTVGGMVFASSGVFSGRVYYYVTIDNMTFDGALNLSSFGITMTGAQYVTILGSKFINYGDANGTGIYFINNAWSANSQITVKSCAFEDNVYGAAPHGSGMLDYSSFEDCQFRRNTVGFEANNWGTRSTTFTNCLFDNNGTGAKLGGVYWYWLKTHHNTFQRCTFANNAIGLRIGDEGATSYNANSYANSVINCDFYNNSQSGIVVSTNFTGSNSPSAEYLDAQGQTFTNNIFLQNGAYGLDNLVDQTIFASYNLAFANGVAAGNNADFSALNYSLLSDPMLLNPASGDFRLTAGSPCIDAGNPGYDSDPATYGDHVDIGAIEFTTLPPAETVSGLITAVEAVPESFYNNKNNSIPLSKKLYVAMQMIIHGDEEADLNKKDKFYHSAQQKLENDILPKTDGCALGGAPDANDWITDCATQADFYGPIISLIDYLSAPM